MNYLFRFVVAFQGRAVKATTTGLLMVRSKTPNPFISMMIMEDANMRVRNRFNVNRVSL